MIWRMSSKFALMTFALLCSAPPSAADGAQPGIDVEIQSRITGNSSLGPDGGKISQMSNLLDLSLPVAGTSKFGLGVDLVVEHLDFHFHDAAGFLPGRPAPLAAAEVGSLQPTALFTPAQHWSFVGSGTVQYAGSENARLGDSTLLSGSVGAFYEQTGNRKIGLGIQVAQQMRASAQILPFPIVDWRFSDRWSLEALDGESGRLSYRVTTAFSVVGQLEFRSQDIRLGRSSSIRSGIMRYEAFPLSLSIEYRSARGLAVSAGGGAAVAQKYRFEDEHGYLVQEGAAHSPWLGTLDIDFSF